ncbi:hypothetical protein BDZ89DRAFT_188068 [Hymenopellis radicata]|nr:hypothetical protein BDZ89DRAFT_188068 [Hymenopellis radicata]
MSLLKVPLLFSDAIGMRISGKPPNATLPRVQHVVPDWREQFLRSLSGPCVLLRAISWSVELIETLVILASHTQSSPLSRHILAALMFRHSRTAQGIGITPLFLFGNVLTITGTFIRISCYRTLGSQFTFELSILKNHRLVVDGPYAFVRHPSYTGMILTIVGAICSQLSGSWIAQSGLLETCVGKVLVGYWVLVASAVIVSLMLRIPREDEMLRRTFGVEWDRWSQRVPYCLVPGVY